MNDLQQRYKALKQEHPKMRARNAAEELGVSEGELLACQIRETAKRLADAPLDILQSLLPLGDVMALTRNEACVHERHGVYDNWHYEEHGKMAIGLFVNPDIDLRLFMNHWKHAFAVHEPTQSGMRKSLQFFDKSGAAIHKIYLTGKSDEAAYEAIVARFLHEDQTPFMAVEDYAAPKPDKDDAEVDWSKFRTEWENLKDTHAFYPLLRKFKIGRLQALNKIGNDFAYTVDNTATRQALEAARDKECEIMVFVGNRGAMQIHTGPVKKLMEHGSWYNVLDPAFNLHLNEEHIAETWVTRKPTEDGIVTAVEVFDKEGGLIVTFFGKRKPGIPELELWREIVSEIPAKEVRHAA